MTKDSPIKSLSGVCLKFFAISICPLGSVVPIPTFPLLFTKIVPLLMFKVVVVNATTLQLKTTDDDNFNTSNFSPYTSGGTVFTIYEISTPIHVVYFSLFN